MSEFYQHMDAASDETVLKFVASEEILHGYYRVIFSNLWRHATEGLEHLKQASSWLDEMNASPIRDAKVQEFLTIANAFKPETRMLPHILNNAANNHSVWSEIQDLCKHAESLKTSNAKPHLVVENPDPSPTSPPTSPQLRQVRRRP
jgi:TnpA family transposase